jgi:hypothetical protein
MNRRRGLKTSENNPLFGDGPEKRKTKRDEGKSCAANHAASQLRIGCASSLAALQPAVARERKERSTARAAANEKKKDGSATTEPSVLQKRRRTGWACRCLEKQTGPENTADAANCGIRHVCFPGHSKSERGTRPAAQSARKN